MHQKKLILNCVIDDCFLYKQAGEVVEHITISTESLKFDSRDGESGRSVTAARHRFDVSSELSCPGAIISREDGYRHSYHALAEHGQ